MSRDNKKTNKMYKNLLLITLLAFLNVNSFSQTTLIPDPNFEQALINLGYDTGIPDGSVPTSNVSAVTSLDVSLLSISDLTGIEAFTNLTILNCNGNSLSTLDVSQNFALLELSCSNNNLTSLDITQNTALTTIVCISNQLTTLDVSQNIALTAIAIGQNSLMALDVSNNVALESLVCFGNNITSLDVSQNSALWYLSCNDNLLTSLDVSQNSALINLHCGFNDLTSLDVSQNANLTDLKCDVNNLTTLNVSQNPSLNSLGCGYNQLEYLNIQNGNNSNFTYFWAMNNPNLNCIAVDNAAYSTANWLDKDPIAIYSVNCDLVSSIYVNGQGGISTITIADGTLQMLATVFPTTAIDPTYTWSVTNGTGSATISATGLLTALSDGTVVVQATANDASGIVGSKTITISNQSAGLNDIPFERISIYPNPTKDIINFSVPTTVQLYTVTGQILAAKKNVNTLDLSNLPTGIYFLVNTDNDGQVIQRTKIVKE
jgi:hypothetical protein